MQYKKKRIVKMNDHYQKNEIQPIDIIDANKLGFYEGNIIKYVLRYKNKNGIEDLKKAKWYLDRMIERMDSNENTNSL